jgi:hypothetical protein
MSDRETLRIPGVDESEKRSQRVRTALLNWFAVPSKHSTRFRALCAISFERERGGGKWDVNACAAQIGKRKPE